MKLGIVMAFGIVAIMLAITLKSRSPELSALVSIALCILLLGFCVSRIRNILLSLGQLTKYIQVEGSYLIILLKLIGVAYICEFAASISKDAGYGAVAAQIELLGKLTMLMVSLPVLQKVVEMILSVLGV